MTMRKRVLFGSTLGLVALVAADRTGRELAAPDKEPNEEPTTAEAAVADTLPEWASFDLEALQTQRAAGGRDYLPFLDVPTLSMGLYELGAGAADPQQPHDRDEVYVVTSGRAVLAVAGEGTPVAPGSVVFVAARVEHRFHSIEEPLSVLVFFAAESD